MPSEKEKFVKDSTSQNKYIVTVGDLNDSHTLYGGRFVSVIDALAAEVARDHSGKACVTRSMDSIQFLEPVYVNELLTIKIAVNRTWNTSMEVGIRVTARRNRQMIHVASAYFTFVSLDEDRKKTPAGVVIPQTVNEKRRYEKADARRQIRLAARN